MKLSLLYSIVFFLASLCLASSNDTNNLPARVIKPPIITKQPDETVYVISRGQLMLPCEAVANPDVKSSQGYSWLKDGKPLQVFAEGKSKIPDGSAVMSSINGSIVFWNSKSLDKDSLDQLEGVYSCQASNGIGVAVTRNTTVLHAIVPFHLPSDETVTADEGDSITVPCDYDVKGRSEVEWKFSKSNVRLSRRIAKSPNGDLVFANVVADLDDGLIVYCTIKDLITRSTTDGTHYTIEVNRVNPVPIKSPKIILPDRNEHVRTVLRGDDIRLTCVTTGNPTPAYQWDVISGKFPENRTRFENSNHTFVIESAREEDAQIYRCKVNQKTLKSLKVNVEARPFFESPSHHPIDTIRAPGEDVSINCKPSGIPKPTVRWLKNGKPLPEAASRMTIQENSIKIANLNKNDSAVYQCVGSNKHGIVLAQAYLSVLYWSPEVCPNNHKQISKQVGKKSVTIKCKVFGSPTPTITWKKGEELIQEGDRFSFPENNSLRIRNLQVNDAGVYSCYAKNEFGLLKLNYTVVYIDSTRLILSQSSLKVERGSDVTVKALANIDPYNEQVGEIEWSKRGLVIGQGTKLQIKNVGFEDGGTYKARVKTEYDFDYKYLDLIVADRPNPPRSFSFREFSNDSLSLRFDWIPGKDFNSTITEYRIDFEEDRYKPGQWFTLEIPAYDFSNTSAKAKLSPGLNYQFKAYAKNKYGWSRNGSMVTRRYRTPNALPKMPTDWKAVGSDPGKIKVIWKEVSIYDRNGPGFGCQIRYKPESRSAAEKDWITYNATANENWYEFKGSRAYIPYIITLQTFNEEGFAKDGPFTTRQYTGEDLPKKSPTEVHIVQRSLFNLTVTWEGIDEESLHGKLAGYKIMYTHEKNDEYIFEAIKVGNVTRCDINNLLPETNYTFKVAAYTQAEGPYSEPVKYTTIRGRPDIGKINFILDENAAEIEWIGSQDGIPADKAYLLYKINDDLKDWQSTMQEAVSENTAVFKIPVTLNTEYLFAVNSSNQYGSVLTEDTISFVPNSEERNLTREIWFIVILCLIALLILVILITCYCKRKKGEKYSVSDKEHHMEETKHSLDKENKVEYNDETDDVKKPLTSNDGSSNGNKNGKASRPRGDSVGGDSIEAFAGNDPQEFNEDGSFIGQYAMVNSPSSNETPTSPASGKHQLVGIAGGDAV